jgi:Domain of unknown function (DUF4214)
MRRHIGSIRQRLIVPQTKAANRFGPRPWPTAPRPWKWRKTQNFIGSAEFQQKYGSLSVSDFVSQLYQNVLLRAGDPAGRQFWTGQLQQGASQASVLVGFSDGLENRVQTAGATHDDWVFIHR